MFMWSKTVKEAYVYEVNFKQSLQFMTEGEKKTPRGTGNYESCDERTKGDGIPPNIERSECEKSVLMSTSKFLLNDTNEDDDRMSNITDIVCENDDERFRKLYNLQGHYSAIQSVTSVFSRVSYHDPTNFF
jgi:hypothetical protein